MRESMRLTVLGSGGNLPTPMPTCTCRVCTEARECGGRYARRGNSLYIHDMNAVIDAPEHIFANLNREGIEAFDYLFLTHWHPDHVAGVRAVQSRNFAPVYEDSDYGLLDAGREGRPTVVTTDRVYERTCDIAGALEHYVSVGWAELHRLDVDGPVEVDGIDVRALPYSLEGDGDEDAAAFVFERNGRTLVVASDDARHLSVDRLPSGIDLAVFECGFFHEDPDGESILSAAELEFLAGELSHEEVLDRVDRVGPDRTILTEIEHFCARSYDDFRALERTYEDVRFAYDGLTVEV